MAGRGNEGTTHLRSISTSTLRQIHREHQADAIADVHQRSHLSLQRSTVQHHLLPLHQGRVWFHGHMRLQHTLDASISLSKTGAGSLPMRTKSITPSMAKTRNRWAASDRQNR